MITGKLRVDMLYILQHFQPAASWHIDVEQQYVRLRSGQLGQHLISVGGFGKVSARKCIAKISLRPRRTFA
jgi:hypothetical protein